MTPEEAENFYEDDEDPEKIFARFDELCRYDPEAQIRWGLTYIRGHYGSSAE